MVSGMSASELAAHCHFSVFSGINYDKPLPPIQVASLRAERIAKEKKVWARASGAAAIRQPRPQVLSSFFLPCRRWLTSRRRSSRL